MSFGKPSELFLLARICFVRLMMFSVSACLVFIASSERKISLLPSMAIHIRVTTCDACAADHVVRFTSPSPSVFAYCKRSKTGAGEGLGTRLYPSLYGGPFQDSMDSFLGRSFHARLSSTYDSSLQRLSSTQLD